MLEVGIIMGSKSDLPVMQNAIDILNEFEINSEVEIVSAHRTPEKMFKYAQNAKNKGIKVDEKNINHEGVVADAIGSLALFSGLGLCVAGSMVLLALTKPGFVFRPLHISTVPSGTTDTQTTTPTTNEDSAPTITPPRSVALADKTSRQIWHKQKLISKRKRHTGYGIFGSNGATTPPMLDPNSTFWRAITS